MTDEQLVVREAFERLTAGNSRFIGAPRTGQAIAIIGGRPIGAAAADAGQRQSRSSDLGIAQKILLFFCPPPHDIQISDLRLAVATGVLYDRPIYKTQRNG